jgi:hypothetical protein
MSLFIDHKYIAQIGPRLERFKRKNQRTYNFRCPICKDSSKSKLKARGFFFAKGNDIGFFCHNCSRSWTFAHFLQEFDPSIYEQYIFERYTTGENHEISTFDEFRFKTEFKNHPNLLGDLPTIESLPNDHYARQYIVNRQIPIQFFSDLYLCSDFKKLIDQFEPDNDYELKENDTRLVIPFKNAGKKITAIQGRSFGKCALKYITIKVDKDAPKIYGLDRVNPEKRVYVMEGPIDSMFIPNAIASAGSNLTSKDLSNFKDFILIFDNEPRNKSIIDLMKKAADSEKPICVWPEYIKEKDVNDMVLAGRTPEEIKEIIDKNRFQGLSARISINGWKHC